MSEEIGTGELSRAVALIRGDIGTLTAALATRPDKDDLRRSEDHQAASLKAAVELQELKNQLQDRAISALEGWLTWILRLGGPSLVALAFGVIFNGVTNR